MAAQQISTMVNFFLKAAAEEDYFHPKRMGGLILPPAPVAFPPMFVNQFISCKILRGFVMNKWYGNFIKNK